MHWGILLMLSLTVPASSAVPLIVPKGTDAPFGSHPWLLSFNGCGASLIRLSESDNASDIAVTAAHCIEEKSQCLAKAAIGEVYFGNENMTYDRNQKVEVTNFTCNPSWIGSTDSKKANLELAIADIAVLKLARPIQFSTIVKGIDLPKKGEVVPRGTTCKIAGWGAINYKRQRPARLQEAEVKIAGDAECAKKQVVIEEYESKSVICAFASANGGRHALWGDSGSALVCRDQANRPVLHGIVSTGYPDGSNENEHEVGVYSEVSFYVDWIVEAIQAMTGRN